MPTISPTTAAKQWKTSKTTVYKLMNDGKLSFNLNEQGKRVLDVSELVRVLGEPKRSQETTVDALQEQLQRQNGHMIQVMQARIDEQAEQIKSLTQAIERFSLVLEHQKIIEKEKSMPTTGQQAPEVASPPLKPAQRKRSLLGRILAAVAEE